MVPSTSDGGDPAFGGRFARVVAAALLVLAVLVPGAPPSEGRVSAVDAATSAATTVGAAQYELMSRAVPRRPLRWLACRAIPYRINPAGMPKGMDRVVDAAMRVVSKQTGVAFVDAGTTKRSFATTARPSTPTIYFAFTPSAHAYGRVFSWPGEIGIGGPSGGWYQDGDGTLYEAITSGRVLLSTTFHGPRLGAGATWQSLIVHEVGHALNLAHRAPVRDVMHGTLTTTSPGRFQPDELAALKPVLQRTGCDYASWKRL